MISLKNASVKSKKMILNNNEIYELSTINSFKRKRALYKLIVVTTIYRYLQTKEELYIHESFSYEYEKKIIDRNRKKYE